MSERTGRFASVAAVVATPAGYRAVRPGSRDRRVGGRQSRRTARFGAYLRRVSAWWTASASRVAVAGGRYKVPRWYVGAVVVLSGGGFTAVGIFVIASGR